MKRFDDRCRSAILWVLWVFAPAIVMVVAFAGFAPGALAVEISEAQLANRRCMNCHGQSHAGELSPAERQAMVAPGTTDAQAATKATRPELYVAPEAFANSIHKDFSCVSCHADAESLPHAGKLQPASCAASCHASQKSDFIQSKHAEALAKGNPSAPTCGTCHGSHDIRRKDDKESKAYPLNAVKLCGDCHKGQEVKAPATGESTKRVAHYLESVHGQALSGGLIRAATCADCHGAHRVLPSADPKSTVSREHVGTTCGQCHAGVADKYVSSIHGQKLAEGNPRAPVCTDCHTAHEITRITAPKFMLDIVNECGTCHEKSEGTTARRTSLYETYRRSYHGQVTQLGSERAARCSSCHGAHDILPADNPKSRLYGQNRVETCRTCHPASTASFAEFQPHADHRDGRRYPLLHGVWLYFVVMMSFAFGFFGLHSVLWFIRSIIERLKHGPHPRHYAHAGTHAIQRFNKVDRTNHAFVIISFFGLALTGLPLLYADKAWASFIMSMFGGVKSAGIAHRIFAVILIMNFVVHGVGVFRRIRKHGLFNLLLGPTTMGPRLKDLQDLLGMYRWFFVGGKKPAFDRWTYWEKFDYMAEVGGSGIIGISGLMLWFPEFFAKFVPGWMFNVATIVHGYEALLAIGFIFTIHFFNAHLRLEKFPVDDVMFTGRLPEDEFKEERGAEYARLEASGELAKLRVAPPPKSYRTFAVIMGIVALAVGTTIVVLIVLAGLGVM